MKNIIVLAINISNDSCDLLEDYRFGKYDTITNKIMHRNVTFEPVKIFDYRVFNLNTYNDVICEYIRIMDGIVILLDPSNINAGALDIINKIILDNKYVPILIYFIKHNHNLAKYASKVYEIVREHENVNCIDDHIIGSEWFSYHVYNQSFKNVRLIDKILLTCTVIIFSIRMFCTI